MPKCGATDELGLKFPRAELSFLFFLFFFFFFFFFFFHD